MCPCRLGCRPWGSRLTVYGQLFAHTQALIGIIIDFGRILGRVDLVVQAAFGLCEFRRHTTASH